MRITLDTNVYVSAFEFQGMAQRLLHMALDGDIEVAVSEPIIRETLRVLREIRVGRIPAQRCKTADP